MTKDDIKRTLDIIYGQIFNQGRADLLPDGIGNYIKQVGRVRCEVKRIAIDGDLAFVHVRYLDFGGRETAGVDIFRFNADGKIVEHWDVLQPVPATSKNANTMF